MSKQAAIKKKDVDAIFTHYADSRNFNATARKFGYTAYMVRKQWGELGEEKQNVYLSEADYRKKTNMQSYLKDSKEEFISVMDRSVSIRDAILEKLSAVVQNVNVETPGAAISILKDAANTLKSVSPLFNPVEAENVADETKDLLKKFLQQSTLNNN